MTNLEKWMIFVGKAQVQFGRRLGLDLTGKTVGVARAMIEDAIDGQFYGRADLRKPTPKQIDLARKFDTDISTVSRRVADAVINDLMTALNHDTIASQRLARDVVVINKHDPLRKWVISSITDDGTVFFRGGNGAKAWARSLIRADETTAKPEARHDELGEPMREIAPSYDSQPQHDFEAC